jgi:ATP-dependent Lon protease
MNLSVKEKQDLLAINDLKERALETLRYMNIELQKLELKNDIQSKVRFDLDQQREYSSSTNENDPGRIVVILRKKRSMKC